MMLLHARWSACSECVQLQFLDAVKTLTCWWILLIPDCLCQTCWGSPKPEGREICRWPSPSPWRWVESCATTLLLTAQLCKMAPEFADTLAYIKESLDGWLKWDSCQTNHVLAASMLQAGLVHSWTYQANVRCVPQPGCRWLSVLTNHTATSYLVLIWAPPAALLPILLIMVWQTMCLGDSSPPLTMCLYWGFNSRLAGTRGRGLDSELELVWQQVHIIYIFTLWLEYFSNSRCPRQVNVFL